MKQRMKNSYEKGLAIRSAPSLSSPHYFFLPWPSPSVLAEQPQSFFWRDAILRRGRNARARIISCHAARRSISRRVKPRASPWGR
jgi:hypothetical protein